MCRNQPEFSTLTILPLGELPLIIPQTKKHRVILVECFQLETSDIMITVQNKTLGTIHALSSKLMALQKSLKFLLCCHSHLVRRCIRR